MPPYHKFPQSQQGGYASRDFADATPSSSSAANPGNSGHASYGFGTSSSSSYGDSNNSAIPGVASHDFPYGAP